jgi:hypothetical protein
MAFMDRELLSGTPQRDIRRARLVRGTLRFANGTVIPILVRNLSERGLGVTCKTRPPARGETVLITLPGSPELDGVVRWVRDRDFGIELAGSVDADELATAIRAEIARIKEAADWEVSTLHRVHNPVSTPRRIV